MRKPVQIAIANNGNFLHMCVLCDDGSMWAGSSGKGLTRLSDIPQDEPEQERQSYVRMSADEVGVLLNIAVAALLAVERAAQLNNVCNDDPSASLEWMDASDDAISRCAAVLKRLRDAGVIAHE